ncbi:uncharacterized protein LOC128865812 isoform X2 [Anastrepha ludens]|uniref:uncharacterized protein LOC128865812 isoform X2 n=1 Tax=Anastrepha ludens TaxID=28586 RepID=UPI0023B12432|nr:uncharacterized protein LOC128865812 isoform X2 [Anastrepha ludens]
MMGMPYFQVKRTPSKRMSFIERAQKESEELVKNMGGSLELDGGRRTRSSTRGTPTRATAVSTPPPAKKARTSPANASNTPSRGRGRGRKIDISEDSEEAKGLAEPPSAKTPEKSETPDKKQAPADKPNNKVSESIDESLPPAEVSEKSIESKGEEAVASASNIEESEDKTDAKADMEPISEEQQNDDEQVTSKEAEAEAPLVQKDDETPMDTGESVPAEEPLADKVVPDPTPAEKPTKLESTAEKTAASTTEQSAPIAVPKQLTPEPMDVDSNSKSSDVELVESAAPATSEDSVEVSVPASAAVESTAPLSGTETIQEANCANTNIIDAESAVNANNIDNTEADIVEVASQAPAPCDVGSVEYNVNTLNATNEVAAIAKTETTVDVANQPAVAESEVNANNDDSAKSGNDLCVPKVVSPSINNANNDGGVATIL